MNGSEYQERHKNTGRNDRCPCGSGKKYKACHLSEDEAAIHTNLAKAAEEREAALAAAGETGQDEAAPARKTGPKRSEMSRKGKTSQSQDRHVNIPRRGAI